MAAPAAAISRFARLRHMLAVPELSFLMEAHSGISAKIVEEAGFEGIWASGLSISASMGLRDNNEASWTQILDTLEFMADATALPILVDGDTGYGNFNNVRRLVRKLCQRGIAGVAIEDKVFPKTNSLGNGPQPLAGIDEFCGRIKAGKDGQSDDDFSIVARIEALIAGQGLDEALRRAEAYHAAGADAVLIHSKLKNPGEILAFMRRWDRRCPVVIVPTTYHATPCAVFREAGISTVVWANHNIRASIEAMTRTSRKIAETQSLAEIEDRIVGVSEIFRLVGNQELEDAEKRYLSPRERSSAVILAATRGSALGVLTADRPKCMVDIRGEPLLVRLVATLKECGVHRLTVVRGYRKEAIALSGVDYADNDAFETTGEIASLATALDKLDGHCLVVYGDILFRRHILDGLLAAPGDIVVAVDALWHLRLQKGREALRDLVAATRNFSPDYLDDRPVGLRAIGPDLPPADIAGEWIGLARFTPAGTVALRAEIARLDAEGLLKTAGMPELLTRLARRQEINVHYVTGQWLDVDDLVDLADARNFS